MVSVVPHGSRWVWISLPGLLILPCEVPIVPHCHIFPRVTLLRLLPLVWKVPIVPHCHVSSRGYPPDRIALHMGVPFSLSQFSHRT